MRMSMRSCPRSWFLMRFLMRFLIFDEGFLMRFLILNEILAQDLEILILEQPHWDFDEKNKFFFRKEVGSNVYQISLHNGSTTSVFSGQAPTRNPTSVAFDEIRKHIYWTDVNLKTINRMSMATQTTSVVYEDGKLYWIAKHILHAPGYEVAQWGVQRWDSPVGHSKLYCVIIQ